MVIYIDILTGTVPRYTLNYIVINAFELGWTRKKKIFKTNLNRPILQTNHGIIEFKCAARIYLYLLGLSVFTSPSHYHGYNGF